jgi:leucyl aminopeptidase
MNVELKNLSFDAACLARTDVLVLLAPSEAKLPAGTSAAAEWFKQVVKPGVLGKDGVQQLQSYADPRFAAKHVVAVHVGKGDADTVRSALSGVLRGLPAGTKTVLVSTHALALTPSTAKATTPVRDWAHALVGAVEQGSYLYTTSKAHTVGKALAAKVTLCGDKLQALSAEFDVAKAVASGVAVAKEWANRPANLATPTHLGEQAKAMGRMRNMHVQVMGPKEVAKLKMGAFMAVAQGSVQPLRFIVMQYKGAPASQAPVVLVGKGITFDTGGISIKPSPEMDEMKYDMGGAASVLGAMQAIGELQPKVNVVALIPSCENMPDAGAIKPGDVVTSMSGQTIEILNTDAEGRLILCDALTYATRYKPDHVIDIATLTGACVIALGHVRSGMFCADDDLAHALSQAGETSGDLCWRMPLDAAYGAALKSNFADIPNIGGGRAGGSITAAKFLEKFTSDYKWAHLDIAGTAWVSGANKGATGRPVPLLVTHVLQHAAQAQAPVRVRSSAAAKRAVKKARST